MMCEHVGGPCICKLARCLSKTPNLKRLDISGNKLGALPETLGDLSELTHLDVSGNALTDLSIVKRLKKLVSLKADDNMVTSLDAEGLDELAEISLCRNAFKNYPDLSWGSLLSPSFNIRLDGNPCMEGVDK
eukprot:CAMPEP_0172624308 /NCGR_PEP_ID=MMETSP1068-20121228/135394_1 /TAXON_ID=35684 /ORGANISM="Pseudopedinella elastica, Strain CCMP716" /LENGTH=131 /DNA_ID=CAMNT_0013433201 /DNA_START=327 /DNA_END=722 /DNA_ORIENTATION=-